jgi:hypothetical protein
LNAPSPTRDSEPPAQPVNYPRDLRAIGQELEKRRFTTFNLKCSGNAYFVWSTESIAPSSLGDLPSTEGESAAQFCSGNVADPAMKMLLDRIVGFQFNRAYKIAGRKAASVTAVACHTCCAQWESKSTAVTSGSSLSRGRSAESGWLLKPPQDAVK